MHDGGKDGGGGAGRHGGPPQPKASPGQALEQIADLVGARQFLKHPDGTVGEQTAHDRHKEVLPRNARGEAGRESKDPEGRGHQYQEDDERKVHAPACPRVLPPDALRQMQSKVTPGPPVQELPCHADTQERDSQERGVDDSLGGQAGPRAKGRARHDPEQEERGSTEIHAQLREEPPAGAEPVVGVIPHEALPTIAADDLCLAPRAVPVPCYVDAATRTAVSTLSSPPS